MLWQMATSRPLAEMLRAAINDTPLLYSRTRAIFVAVFTGVLTAIFHGSQILWDITFFTIFSVAICYDAALLWRLLMIAVKRGRPIENIAQDVARARF